MSINQEYWVRKCAAVALDVELMVVCVIVAQDCRIFTVLLFIGDVEKLSLVYRYYRYVEDCFLPS